MIPAQGANMSCRVLLPPVDLLAPHRPVGGGHPKKNLTMDVEVHAPSLSKALEKGLSFESQKFEKVNYLSTEM